MARRRDEEYQSHFGRRLRKVREAAGLTQEQLASRIGSTPAVVSRIETGASGTSVAMLLVLARGLSVRPAELLELEADLPEPSDDGRAALLAAWEALPEDRRRLALRLVQVAGE